MMAERKRRARGEGSIYQRADGIWIGSVLVPSFDGKKRQRRVSSKSYRECLAKLKQMQRELEDGTAVGQKMTLAAWLDRWINEIHKDEIRPKTRSDYIRVVKQISESIGDRRLDRLTPEDVRGMITHLGKGRRRTQKAHAVLQSALKDAEREGLVHRNVASVVHKPKTDSGGRQPIALADARAVLFYAEENKNKMESARWMVAFLTGLRSGECLGLEWDRIDLDAGVADVSWQLQQLTQAHGCGTAGADKKWPCGKIKAAYCSTPIWDVPPGYEIRPLYRSLVLTRPKTRAGQRFVPLVPPLVEALREVKKLDVGLNPHGLLFHRGDGTPVSPREDSSTWVSLCRESGICGPDETVHMHRIRHTAATLMRAAGVDEQTRQELLGHSSAEAQRIYAHADLGRQREAMASLAALTEASDAG